MSLRARLENQILDQGRISWTEESDAATSPALFEKLIEALEELKAAGLFAGLHCHIGNYREGKRVDKVSISGINEDYDIRLEDRT